MVDILQSFLSKTRKSRGCWQWLASKTRTGYGRMWINNGSFDSAHRVAYGLFVGRVPKGKCVLHSCDNPWCVNPKHLWLGTQAENNLDKIRKGRANMPKGSAHGMAKLHEVHVRRIRTLIDMREWEIAKEYGISMSLVGQIRRGEIWRHA